jgi:protein-tyrosine sulfotransferase
MQRCLITLIILAVTISSEAADMETCEHLIEGFQLRNRGSGTQPDPSKMLWFLHIPRSAGRTFHSCFLKLAHPPSKRCAKSYDVLRLNISVGSCGLLASHDDYSATDFLPAQAAIVTQLRDPVDRVVSAYEFAVEVAARVLERPSNYTADPSKTNTRNVWPWSKLVPLIERDLLPRVGGIRQLYAMTYPDLPAMSNLAHAVRHIHCRSRQQSEHCQPRVI